VHQIAGRARSIIVNSYIIVHQDGLQGRANDLINMLHYNNKSGKKFGMNAWHEILSLNGLF